MCLKMNQFSYLLISVFLSFVCFSTAEGYKSLKILSLGNTQSLIFFRGFWWLEVDVHIRFFRFLVLATNPLLIRNCLGC